MEKLCKSAEETVSLGFEFGKKLKSGDVVCLIGDLGAGKTTFTKGIAQSMSLLVPLFQLCMITAVKSLFTILIYTDFLLKMI